MAGETVITVIGNLTSDPELRFTPSGAAVANFRIASTPRRFNSQTNQWEDGEGLFLTCNVWRQAAENVAESLQKGMVAGAGKMGFELWVDDQQVPRKLVLKGGAKARQVGTGKMVMTMKFSDFGEPVNISAPPASQVTDFPHPDSPTSATASPRPTERSTPRNAGTPSKVAVSPAISTSGGIRRPSSARKSP